MHIHPTDSQQIAAMLGVAQPPKELEQEYFIRVRMLHLAGLCAPLGPTAIIDMLRSLGFDPAEEPRPCVPWERYPQDGTIRVEGKNQSRLGDTWVRGVFLGLDEKGIVATRVGNDPIIRWFLPSDVRLAADQDAGKSDTLSLFPDSLDASAAPCDMEVPDVGPDDPTVIAINPPAPEELDWCMVGSGTTVYARDPFGVREGAMVAVAGNSLLLQFPGDDELRWFDMADCSLYCD